MDTVHIIFSGALLLLLSVLAGKTSFRLGLPTLILFLLVGMLAGSEGFGGIYFDDSQLAQFIGIIALNIILFSGGLDTRWGAVRLVLGKGLTLATLGVFITAAAVGIFAHYFFDWSWLDAFLLGAIVSSTDAAAVFSILGSTNIHLKHGIRPILELESGSNDPMAYFLTSLLAGAVLKGDMNLAPALLQLILQLVVGVSIGYLMGRLSKWIINNIRLDFKGLYPVLALSLSFLAYASSELLSGNGFLAVYVSAVFLANSQLTQKLSIRQFFDGFAWLMQIILFLSLGLLVFPSQLLAVWPMGLALAFFLMFIARPISVFIGLSWTKLDFKSKLFISWVGLRGAAPIVFATIPMVMGIQSSNLIFNLVFFLTLVSIALQGMSIPFFARLLGLVDLKVSALTQARSLALEEESKVETAEVYISAESPLIDQKLADIHFPADCMVVLIIRKQQYLVPTAHTKIEAGDTLQLLASKAEDLASLQMELG
ncbi:potassium/proton antiporter [Saprospira grandis]|uniref:potassium/proton antiporter n=1 Tax=Saprospira grandis TaxID=1008 RepID=UPI0022DDDE43|nr:potassium/proton antiporter [Saprospira grandis]WBM74517.1 potassium/proton antiporter [Saprospira grandis]